MAAPLTPAQRRVLDFLREFVERHRFAPTAAEIAGRFGIAVKNGFYYLELLERKGYILQPKFIFIDGRTGTVLHSENFREEVLYNANQSTPALSSYFELMDRLIPSFLSTLSSQKIKGTRVLLEYDRGMRYHWSPCLHARSNLK